MPRIFASKQSPHAYRYLQIPVIKLASWLFLLLSKSSVLGSFNYVKWFGMFCFYNSILPLTILLHSFNFSFHNFQFESQDIVGPSCAVERLPPVLHSVTNVTKIFSLKLPILKLEIRFIEFILTTL